MKQEKRMAKRIFSALLTLTMAFVSFPTAFSFDAAAASATSGKTGDCTWTLNGTVLTISGNGMMGIYSYYSPSPWGKDITEVVIRYGVVDVGNSAFSGCTSLRSITIPYSVRSIDYAAFSGCTSLTSITIPDSVTSISYSAFSGCTSLTSITIPDSVTRINNYAFYGCTSLTSITIPFTVTSIDSSAFYGCTSLTSITIPDNVTRIGDSAFSGCTSLTDITIPDSVTSIEWDTFSGCTSLTSITIPDSVTSIGNSAFSGCTSLTSITIPDSVISVSTQAFNGCKIKELHIADGSKTVTSAMIVCKDTLEKVTIPDSVTSIDGSAFYNTGYYDDPANWNNGILYISNHLIAAKNTLSGECRIREGVKSIGGSAFSGCTSLTSITIPDSVTSISESAFSNCKSLTDITIPDGVRSIDYAAFSGCTSLTSITIPDSVISVSTQAFNGCKIKELHIADGSKTVTSAMVVCKDTLEKVTIPDSVTSIDNAAFFGCANLKTVLIDENNPVFHSAGNCVIHTKSQKLITGCKNSVIPTDGSVTSIGDSAFYGCTNLTSVTIPDSVTSIGSSAFSGCTSLTSITIPDSVTSIGNAAFGGCKNLTIRTPENSTAHKYAKSEGINYYLTNVTTQPSAPTVDGSQKADESSVTVTLRVVAGYEYRCNDGAWQNNPVFSGLSFGGRYRFYQRLAESPKNVAGPTSEPLIVTVKNKNSTVPIAPDVENVSFNTVVLKQYSGYEYSMDGKTWQSSNTFTGLTANTTYMFYQRIAETDDAFASISSAATEVRTSCYHIRYEANGGTGGPGTQEITSENDTVSAEIPQREGYTFCGWNMLNDPITIYHPGDIYGLTKDNTLYAMWAKNCENCHATGKVTTEIREKCNSCSGSGYQYKCSRCGRRVTLVTTGIGSYWQCSNCGVVSASRSSCIACNGRGYITDDHMDTCTVCAGSGQISEEAPVVLQYTDTKVLLREKSGCEYSADGIHFQKSAIFTGLSPATTYSFSQRKAQNGNSPFGVSGPTTKVTTDKSRPLDIPEAPTLESRTADTIVLRSISGYEYSKDGAIWYSSAKFTGLDCGTSYTFYQRVAATDTSYAGKTSASATFRTDKGTKKAPPIPIVESKTHNTVVLKPVDGCEYSKDGVTWQSSKRFTGLDPLTNYFFYQRFVESDRYYVSPSSASLSVRTEECPPYIPGDLDGDEKITDADAVYLLMHTFFPDEYPVDQGCDFDGDGKVTDADAVYLLMYTFFPDEYPIQ